MIKNDVEKTSDTDVDKDLSVVLEEYIINFIYKVRKILLEDDNLKGDNDENN